MKKILFLLFILVAPVKIFASETIYSEYSSFSPFQEDTITSNE